MHGATPADLSRGSRRSLPPTHPPLPSKHHPVRSQGSRPQRRSHPGLTDSRGTGPGPRSLSCPHCSCAPSGQSCPRAVKSVHIALASASNSAFMTTTDPCDLSADAPAMSVTTLGVGPGLSAPVLQLQSACLATTPAVPHGSHAHACVACMSSSGRQTVLLHGGGCWPVPCEGQSRAAATVSFPPAIARGCRSSQGLSAVVLGHCWCGAVLSRVLELLAYRSEK